MESTFILLPQPRQITPIPGTFALDRPIFPQMISPGTPGLKHAIPSLMESLPVSSSLREEGGAEFILAIDPGLKIPSQGYGLTITPDRILLESGDEAGLVYGIRTLQQLLQQSPVRLPCLDIRDFPDFPVRGVMLDISRDKVPTQETLHQLIDLLASWKINQFQLYVEHTFAYSGYPEVWENASPLTPDEIRELDAYCAERLIELVPNQNSFGHMKRWLIHPRLAPLAELQGKYDTPWGVEEGPYSLCPVDPRSSEFLGGLYDELLPNFSSRLFNAGCDETFDVGQGRSREACERNGKGRVYLDFLKQIHALTAERGHTMLFWADILMQYPKLTPEVPKDAIALDWGYEADAPFEEHSRTLADTGLAYYVCPGTSSWNSIAGRTTNALQNLRNAAEAGIKHHAAGYLITDWGDNGHWQMLPVSYLGFAAGAALSWALDANRERDFSLPVSLFAFHDPTGETGRFFAKLGDVYRLAGYEPPNSSTLFWLLKKSLPELKDYTALLSPEGLDQVEAAIRQSGSPQAGGPEGSRINREGEFTRRLLLHACKRGRLLLDTDPAAKEELKKHLQPEIDKLIQDTTRLWLERNRPGGLADSLEGFVRIKQEYLAE